MKKYFSYIRFWSVLIILFAFRQESFCQVVGVWTGNVQMKMVYNGVYGTSTTILTARIVNNRATGTMVYDQDFMIGNIKLVSHCEGEGVSELYNLYIEPDKKNFDFATTGPEFQCEPKDGVPGAGGRDLGFSAPVKGIGVDVLYGTKVDEIDTPGYGIITTTYTWDLHRSPNGGLVVIPSNYDDWLPEPGKDELAVGSQMDIEIKLLGPNGAVPPVKIKSFELELSNTSHEPGITLNAPIKPLFDLPDLGFISQGAIGANGRLQKLKIDCPNGCTTAHAKIGSYDGGGWTTLTVKAKLEDNTEVEGHLINVGGITEIPIPKRNPNQKIGQSWLIANADPAELDDKETSKGNQYNGDGLTAYEEYRGVISEGKFKRLDPRKKELGVWMNKSEFPLFEIGLEWFQDASEVKVIKFFNDEIGPQRRLNANVSFAHDYNQNVVRLQKEYVRKYVLGRTEPGPGIPVNVTRIKIDYNQIVAMQQKSEKEALEQNVTLPYGLGEMVAKTVAHELGHAVNILHHGEGKIETRKLVVEKGMPIHIYYKRGQAEIIDRPHPIEGVIGDINNQESGDIFCLMSYNPCYDWSQKVARDGSLYYFMVPLIPIGNEFCNSPVGKDINEPINGAVIYFGDALPGRGNCLNQIKLRN